MSDFDAMLFPKNKKIIHSIIIINVHESDSLRKNMPKVMRCYLDLTQPFWILNEIFHYFIETVPFHFCHNLVLACYQAKIYFFVDKI